MLPGTRRISENMQVRLQIDSNDISLFDATNGKRIAPSQNVARERLDVSMSTGKPRERDAISG